MEQIIEPKTKYKNNYMSFMFYMISDVRLFFLLI